MSIDALFLHVPRWTRERREIMAMPLGLPALANLLADQGRQVALLHWGIEREVDPQFSLRAWLQQHRPKLVLLSLHWHQQTRAVIEVAQRIATWLPDTTIVLGGLTASVFAREAVVSLPFLKGVVRGDGEVPLLAIARIVVEGQGDWSQVPNLVWRDAEGVHDNGLHWCLDSTLAGQLRHADLRLLRHSAAYVERALYADFSEGSGYPKTAYLNAGRGCLCNCLVCGGAAQAQRVTSQRQGILLYPLEKLVRDVGTALAQGVESLRVCFDPPPARARIRSWFEAIRAQGWSPRLLYDFWFLPSRELLTQIASTFLPGSLAVLSPECGSEQVRARVRGMPFSNNHLLRSVHQIEELGLQAHCFFSAGLPGETLADIEESARLIERLRTETRAGISVCPLVLDPASPLFLNPEQYGVRLVRRTLADFYDEKGVARGPGYTTEYLDEEGILAACDRLLKAAGLPTADNVL